MPPRITVLGACNVDFTFRAARLPFAGETLPGRQFYFDFGGKGANQAVTAARLGASVTLISRVGDDEYGDKTRAQLQKEGIRIEHVARTTGHQTGAAVILVDDAGRNAIIGIPGANAVVSPADIAAARPALEGADAFLATLEVPQDALLAALTAARRAGVTTILNPAPVFSIPDELYASVDYLIPNETELAALCGRPLSAPYDIEVAARELLSRGARHVLVTLGERGALWVHRDGTQLVPAIPVTAVDTTGAGDTFIGSLAVFLSEGVALSAAIGRANAVAALTVTRPGAQAAIPRRSETRF